MDKETTIKVLDNLINDVYPSNSGVGKAGLKKIKEFILDNKMNEKKEEQPNRIETILSNMKQIEAIKLEILRYLTENSKNNQAIFNREQGYAIFNNTDLDMVMDKVTCGLYSAKKLLERNE